MATALYKMPRNEKFSLELWKMIGFWAVPYLPKCKMTLILDDSPYEKVCQDKMCLFKSKMTPSPRNKKSAKKNIFTINFIH